MSYVILSHIRVNSIRVGTLFLRQSPDILFCAEVQRVVPGLTCFVILNLFQDDECVFQSAQPLCASARNKKDAAHAWLLSVIQQPSSCLAS
jgi:hypothetical protein